jgi:hypothetical protein
MRFLNRHPPQQLIQGVHDEAGADLQTGFCSGCFLLFVLFRIRRFLQELVRRIIFFSFAPQKEIPSGISPEGISLHLSASNRVCGARFIGFRKCH